MEEKMNANNANQNAGQKEQTKQQGSYDMKKYANIAGLVFLVLSGVIAVYFIFAGLGNIRTFFGKVTGILTPILLGIVIAYILNPIANFWERCLIQFAGKSNMGWLKKAARLISAIFTIFLMIAGLVIAGWLLLPQIIDSVVSLVRMIPHYAETAIAWIQKISSEESSIALSLENALQNLSNTLIQWMKTDMLTTLQGSLTYVTNGVFGIASTIMNCLVGVIVSIYVLSSKQIFIGEGKKIIYALFNRKQAHVVLDTVRKSHEIFGGFITGKLVDSLIIGLIALASLTLLKMPYAILVAVIVGVTNVIPFFGPYIGAVPSAVLIFLASPKQCIIFVIFIIVLQQFDGNILGPKILGESTGLSAFWVVFSILLFGGLFGVMGMLVGVPTFAVIYYIAKTYVEHVLKKKKLPVPSGEYQEIDYIGEGKGEIYYRKDSGRWEEPTEPKKTKPSELLKKKRGNGGPKR